MPKDTKNSNAISHWINAHEAALQRFIRAKTPDAAQVEDILQDVWTKLLEHPAPESILHLRNWLFTVARNLMLDRRRKQKALCFSQLAPEVATNLDLYFNAWASAELPSDVLESQEFWDALQAELARLPPAQREVFVQHELEAIPMKELSLRSGIPINTLLSRKRYAVLHLRKRFEQLKRK